MNNEFNIQLKAELDESSSEKKIIENIRSIQKRLEESNDGRIKLKAEIDSALLKSIQDVSKSKPLSSAGKDMGSQLATNLINSFNIKGKDAQKQIKELSKSLYNISIEELKTGKDNPAFINTVNQLGSVVEKNANVIKERMGIYDDFYKYFQGLSKIKIPDSVKKELGNDWNSMRMISPGKFITFKNGIELDSIYQEMSDKYKDIFSGTTDQTRQFKEIVNAVKAYRADIDKLEPVDLNKITGFSESVWDDVLAGVGNMRVQIKEQLPKIFEDAEQPAQVIGYEIGESINNGINSSLLRGKDFQKTYDSLKDAKNDFDKLFKDENATITTKEHFDDNKLKSFTISIKQANGEVDSLNYKLKNTKFEFVGGSINDSAIERQKIAIEKKVDELQIKLDKLRASYSDINAGKPIKDPNNILALSSQYDKVTQAIENVRNSNNKTFSSMTSNAQKEISVLNSMISQFRNAETIATNLKNTDISTGIKQVQERLGRLKANSVGFEQMKQIIHELDDAIANVGDKTSLDSFINKLKVAESQLGRVKAESRTMATDLQLGQAILRLNNQLQRNSRYTKDAKDQVHSWIAELENGNVASSRLKEINLQAKQLHSNMEGLNRTGKGFFETLREKFNSLGSYLSAAVIVSKSLSGIKSGISSVRELDTALVDLKKTANMTSRELIQFYKDSNDVAKQMGVTTEQIINQASAWSRFNKIDDPLYGNI